METPIEKEINAGTDFARDVLNGLSADPKHIPSKYFYDTEGDRLFQCITHLKEYYIMQSEYEIFSRQKTKIRSLFNEKNTRFQLIELGAGDGFKTKMLLQHFFLHYTDFKYIPIDISAHALDELVADLNHLIPELEVEFINDEYFKALEVVTQKDKSRKVILFLGAGIGNFREEEAFGFLTRLASCITPDDLLMIGFDLKKDPRKILKAYKDDKGITEAFNLNLLRRINNELDGDFNLSKFLHYPVYDPFLAEAKSYLVSTEQQTVHIRALDISFSFKEWETVLTETAKKYDADSIAKLASAAGFKIVDSIYDEKRYYVDSVWSIK